MPHVRAFLRAARGWRLVAIITGVTLLIGAKAITSTVEKMRAYVQEVRALRARLAEKTQRLEQEQLELAQVAAAVDRVTRTATGVRERAALARRTANMEESRDPVPDAVPLPVSIDAGRLVVSADGARTLDALGWVEGQLTSAADSLAVLTALVKEPRRRSLGAPSIWPVRGLVTSTFGSRFSPYGGGRELHPGIDIQARYGAPVGAGGDGEVVFAGRDPGYGGLVIIDHGRDTETLYGHLSAIYVREGQRVRKGQPVGALGASGRATGAHLHYEVRVNNEPVDPNRYLVN